MSKIKSLDPIVLAVANYYNFKTVGKFRKWLESVPKCLKLYYHNDKGELKHARPARLLKNLY